VVVAARFGLGSLFLFLHVNSKIIEGNSYPPSTVELHVDLGSPHVNGGVHRAQDRMSQDDGDVDVGPHVQHDEVNRDVCVVDLDQDVPCQSLWEPDGLPSAEVQMWGPKDLLTCYDKLPWI